jgi:hypothetical protein
MRRCIIISVLQSLILFEVLTFILLSYFHNTIAMDDLIEYFDGDEEAAKDRVGFLAGALRRKRKLEALYERSIHSADTFIRRQTLQQRPALMDIQLPDDLKDIVRDFLMHSKTTIQQYFKEVMEELFEAIADVSFNPELKSQNLPGNLVAVWTLCLGAGGRHVYETTTNTSAVLRIDYLQQPTN